MSVKVTIEDFGSQDVLVVNGETVSGEDQPAPPPAPPPEYNHFDDFMDKRWGKSFTFTDDLETVFFSNIAYDTPKSRKTLQFDMTEDVGGRYISFGNGGHADTLGPVEFRSGGVLIGSGTLHQTGSVGFNSDDIAADGLVEMKFMEGGSTSALQCAAYPG